MPSLPKLLSPVAPDTLLSRVGRTPLVRLRSIPKGLVADDVQIWCKLEWFNPGGSIKDRAAAAMVLDAERRGLLRPGSHLLESSSGNTGIALAWIAASRGYRLTLCMPANANAERKRTLLAHGVELIATDPLEGSDGAIHAAREIYASDPERYVYLDQYGNPANSGAHYEGTGPEIWAGSAGRITDFVSCLGTSGTFMGTARFLKERSKRIRCHTIEPDSPFHGLEGMKHMESALVPDLYAPDGLADSHLGAPTEASYALVRRLAREEGLLAGISSGAAVWGALEIGKGLERGLVVAILPDGGTRYLSDPNLWEER